MPVRIVEVGYIGILGYIWKLKFFFVLLWKSETLSKGEVYRFYRHDLLVTISLTAINLDFFSCERVLSSHT